MQDQYDRQCLVHSELLQEAPGDDERLWCGVGGHLADIWAVVRLSDRKVAFLADRFKGAAGADQVAHWLLKSIVELGAIQARKDLHVDDLSGLWQNGQPVGKVVTHYMPAGPRVRDSRGRYMSGKLPRED